MTYTFECPECGEEHAAEVDVGEHLVDFEDVCSNCDFHYPQSFVDKVYSNALEDCWGQMIDNAHEAQKDKELLG